MTAALLLLQFPCSAPVAHPPIYGEAASGKGPYGKEGGGWMAMPAGLAPAARPWCSPGLRLFSCFVSSVSKHFRWIAQLFKG